MELSCRLRCALVWLDLRPVLEHIEKLYEHYPTHETTDRVLRLAGLRSIIKNSVLAAGLGYDNLAVSPLQKVPGKGTCWVGLIKGIIELHVMTLSWQEGAKLPNIGCGSGQFLARMQDMQ